MEAAQGAVTTLTARTFEEVSQNDTTALPGLLDLFGYRVPPPPSAHDLVKESVNLITALGDSERGMEEVAAAREKLRQLLDRADEIPESPPMGARAQGDRS